MKHVDDQIKDLWKLGPLRGELKNLENMAKDRDDWKEVADAAQALREALERKTDS